MSPKENTIEEPKIKEEGKLGKGKFKGNNKLSYMQ